MKFLKRDVANVGRFTFFCCAVLLLEVLMIRQACAQEGNGPSRWSVGFHLGVIANNNSDAMRLGTDADSLDPLDVGLKDALRSGVSLDYDVWHDSGFGLSAGGFYSQSSLDFGLVNGRTGVARHLGDARVHLLAITSSFDLGDHGLFESPEHNNFLLATGLIVGTAWLSSFDLDQEASAQSDIAGVSAGSEMVFGVQSKVLWRPFDSRWVIFIAGAFLHGNGDSFLALQSGSSRGNSAVSSAIHFALFEGGVSCRL